MFKKYTNVLLCAALLFGTSGTAVFAESDLLGETANAEFTAKIQPELLAAARAPETSPYDFMILCKRLQVYGNAEAAAVVASQLNVPEKSHSARMTLEILPCAEAAAELRKAVGTVTDPVLKAGVFNSLGMRQDTESAALLIPYLTDENAVLSNSAAFALARIGKPEYAAEMMQYAKKAVAGTDYTQMKQALDLNLMYGEFLRRNGFTADAERVFLNIDACAPRDFYHYAAYFQLLLDDNDLTYVRMTEWLTGSDELKYTAALRSASFLEGPKTADVLMNVFSKVEAARQPAILEALGVQRDTRSQGLFLEAMQSENADVAAAAVKAIQNFTDGVGFDDLFRTAANAGTPELRAGSVQVLTLLPASANMEILKKLESKNDTEKALAVELAGLRKISAAVPVIRALAQSGNAAAMRSFGSIAVLEDVPILVSGLKSADAALSEAAKQALSEACALMEDKNALASALSEAIYASKDAKDARFYLFQMLNVAGGTKALEVLRTAALSDDAELQDDATNVLGRTLDPTAAAVLLELAQKDGYPYANRAVRGYLRIARQFPMASWNRTVMIRNARACAAFTEKEAETAAIIVKQYKLDPEGKLTPEQEILSALEVVSAVYGVEEAGKNIDVTVQMREKMLHAEALAFSLNQQWNEIFTDPAPGVPKFLKLVVRMKGEEKELKFREGGTIRIPQE